MAEAWNSSMVAPEHKAPEREWLMRPLSRSGGWSQTVNDETRRRNQT